MTDSSLFKSFQVERVSCRQQTDNLSFKNVKKKLFSRFEQRWRFSAAGQTLRGGKSTNYVDSGFLEFGYNLDFECVTVLSFKSR